MFATSRRWFSCSFIAFSVISTINVRGEETFRPYADGPLTIEDFRAAPPADAKLAALTSTELRFTYQFRTRTENGETSGHLTQLAIQAYVRPDRCWNRRPDDKALLDHEQGHFDIAEIHARRARIEAVKRIKEKSFKANGKNAKEVQESLAEQILGFMRSYEKAMQIDDAAYDEKTAHGLAAETQREWRRVHFESLRSLEEPKSEPNAGKTSNRRSQ